MVRLDGGAGTGVGVKHRRAVLCLKAFISILLLQQSVAILPPPRAETTQEENVRTYFFIAFGDAEERM